MITTIILSKDRPAQLDLLLQSIKANGNGWFSVCIVKERGPLFETIVSLALEGANEHVCFMCDDGILYRPIEEEPPLPESNELCFSLRLGDNTTSCYPSAREYPVPTRNPWWWTREPDGSDFGYPGSLDGHVFHTAELRELLDFPFDNPTALEATLAERCHVWAAAEKISPLMRSFSHSVYVGNPVNRVSEQSGVRFGQRYPSPAGELAERFARGDRLSLEAMDFSGVDGAHCEVELRWASEVATDAART